MSNDLSVISNKVIYSFNKISLMFVKELKGISDQLKVVIKKNYRTYDKLSSSYIDKFDEALKDVRPLFFEEGNAFDKQEVCECEILKDLTIQTILEKTPCENHPLIYSYIYAMFLMSHLYNELTEENSNDIDVMLTKCLSSMNSNITADNLDEYMSDILDDEVRFLTRKVHESKTFEIPLSKSPEETHEYMKMFEGTKIGALAKDISESININDFQGLQGGDMSALFDGSGASMIGSIIQKVGSSITNKIQSGELSQEDLMKEAMNIMGMGGGLASMFGAGGAGGMMQDMMAAAMGSGSSMGNRNKQSQQHGRRQRKLLK
jgi:hypothetical protein